MKLYDLLMSSDTRPMDRLRREIPEWDGIFLLVPSNSYSALYIVNTVKNTMHFYYPIINELKANDWAKF